MDWTRPVDLYCERTDAAFWAEPVNALSNLAFIAAALYGLALWRRSGGRDRAVAVLAAIAGLVGLGSFLFHTVATPAAMLADVVPIALFIAMAFGVVLHRLAGLNGLAATVAAVAFTALSPILQRPFGPLLGSSAGYAPALAALAVIGGWLWRQGVPGAGFLVAAAGVFAVSIAFRMADGAFCDALPLGTHFAWHLLNGAVLALVIRAVARR